MPAFLPILAAAGLSGGMDLIQGLATRPKVSAVDRARLAELERMEAMGRLGLTDEERAALRAQRVSPVQALAAEQNRRLLAAQAPGGGGAGAFAAQALAGADASSQALASALRDVQAYDVAEMGRQKQEMRDLESSLEAQREARRQATIQAVLSGVEAATQSAFGAGMGAPPASPAAVPEVDMDQIQRFMKNYNVG